jgi:hypothetical protein
MRFRKTLHDLLSPRADSRHKEGTMKSSNHWLGRLVAVLLALLLVYPASEAGTAAAQQSPQGETQPAPSSIASAPSPGNSQIASADPKESLPDAPAPAAQSPADAGQQPSPAPSGNPPQQNPRKPVGAAAAPYEPTMGVAASRPAGAAIAPAKQRRVRTIVISLGIIAGAGIAVGSIAALSHGSPSRP